MDEKVEGALKGIYESLTDERRAKACRTMDELTAPLRKMPVKRQQTININNKYEKENYHEREQEH